MPRLYRQAPLNSIWEGSGNVQCLDVLRAMSRDPDSMEALQAELWAAKGENRHYDAHLQRLQAALADREDMEPRARRLTEEVALALQASVLIRAGNAAVSDAFCAARLGGDAGLAFGTLPPGLDLKAIVERARPVTG